MNNNDILKQFIRENKSGASSLANISGVAIAAANRTQLDEWLTAAGFDSMLIIAEFRKTESNNPTPVQSPPPVAPSIQPIAPPIQPIAPQSPQTPAGIGAMIESILAGAMANASPLTPEKIAEITAEVKTAALDAVLETYGSNGGRATRIEILAPPDETPRDMGVQHAAFPLVMRAMQAGVHIALVGPAGTGKTTIAEHAARALSRPLFSISCGPDTLRSDLIGRADVNGGYHKGVLPLSMEAGGIYLADEADKLNGALAPMQNSALANRSIGLPTGERVEASPDWQAILAMNTFGTGATDLYQSARQDAATMDRLFFLHVDYDNALEASLCGITTPQRSPDYSLGKGGMLLSADAWVSFIQAIRHCITSKNIKHVVSPRASLMGCKLATAGIGVHWLLDGLVFKGLKPEQVETIKSDCSIQLGNLTL